jgi:hypothetical protein
MASDPEAEVNDYNRRELWHDIANHLDVAVGAIEQAQGALEDLATYGVTTGTEWADQLDPHREAIRRAANDAREAHGNQ